MVGPDWLSRTELLLGNEKLEKLRQAHVLVVGLGGVGSFAAEFLCRAGVGRLTIVDGDVVAPSNRNRQLPALATTQGLPKAAVMAERLLAINPELALYPIQAFITPGSAREILEESYDFLVDAIDSIAPKTAFLQTAHQRQTPVVSSMGAGGKLDPTQVRAADIAQTYHCPFARNVRKRLKEVGIRQGITAVFSPEPPLAESMLKADGAEVQRAIYGTISYLPAVFGGVCAAVAINKLTA